MVNNKLNNSSSWTTANHLSKNRYITISRFLSVIATVIIIHVALYWFNIHQYRKCISIITESVASLLTSISGNQNRRRSALRKERKKKFREQSRTEFCYSFRLFQSTAESHKRIKAEESLCSFKTLLEVSSGWCLKFNKLYH